MTVATLPKLHDATLLTVRSDWERKTVEIEIRAPGGAFTLVWEDVVECSYTHRETWGPSVSILGGQLVAEGRFEFEIQSGDTLVVVGTGPRVADA